MSTGSQGAPPALRGPIGRGLSGSRIGMVVVLAALVSGSGCGLRGGAPARPLPEALPLGSPLLSATLQRGDAWVRHHLMLAEYDEALQVLDDSRLAPGDRLLRALQEGVVLHRAGEYARSNEVLDWAEREADRRYTRSATRGLASLGIGDRALAYAPSPAELAMVPFYRMLNYLALGEMGGAMVEARKANALTGAADDEVGDCRAHGMLAYLSGLVQTAGGDRNDALVSLRQAEALYLGCGPGSPVSRPSGLGGDLYRAALAAGIPDLADSVAVRYGLGDEGLTAGGDVLLVVEEGFVAHRSAEALHVPIHPEDIEGLDGSDSDALADAAARIAARLVSNLSERAMWGRSVDDLQWVQWASALEGAYVLRLAWPGSRREGGAPAGMRVRVGDSVAPVWPAADVSSLVERDLQAQRPAMLGRLVARGLAKYLLAREVEARAEEQGGEIAAFVAGRIANAAANELERADTRSWSLLPERISLSRLRLPPGRHRLALETLAEDGSVLHTHDLGEVEVVAGGLTALSRRVWSN